VGVPTSTPCGEEGLGDELESELTTSVLEHCGVGLLCCRCCAGSMWWRPNDQERCVLGSRLLAFGCLGSRSVKMCSLIQWSFRRVSPSWAAGCPELRRGPARLQVSESVWVACCLKRRRDVRCGCRQVSPSCAADCPEKRRGLLLLLLVMG